MLLCGLAACQDRNQRAATLAQQADAYAQAGNIVAAREAIRGAIALREDEPAYHKLMGAIEMRAENPVEAYRAFSRALEFDATDQVALAYVANLGVQIGQINDAEDAADRLLTLAPNAQPALQVKGMVALSREKFDDAAQYGDRLLAVNATDEAGTIIKARALAKAGKAEEALALLDNAMVSGGNSAALLTNKVNLYRFLRQPVPMAAALNDLIKRNGANAAMRLDQVNLLYKLGRKDDARQAALRLLTDGVRDPNNYSILQNIWWQFDKTPIPEGPARDARRWKDSQAVVVAVRFLLRSGDYEAADALLRSASPEAQAVLGSLKARLLVATGHGKDVPQDVGAVGEEDDNDVDALLLRAMFARDKRQFGSAIQAGQLAQTNDPLDPETYTMLASIYRAEGNDFRARQMFEQGLKALPQNFYLVESYTQYLHQLGDKGRAVSVARSFARAVPSAERAWVILSEQCQWAGDETCLRTASEGLTEARTTYLVDNPPGTPIDRGLFGRI